MERKKGFEPSTFSLARRRSTAELLPHLLPLYPIGSVVFSFVREATASIQSYITKVPRRRFELLRACAHHPLKMACLPIPPPRRLFGNKHIATATSDYVVAETFALGGILAVSLEELAVSTLLALRPLRLILHFHMGTPSLSFWQGWKDSNPRPAVLETAALAN